MSARVLAVVENPHVTNVVACFHAVKRGRIVASVSVCEYYPGVFGLVHSDAHGKTTGSGGVAGLSRTTSIVAGLRAAHQYGLRGATHVLRDGDEIERPVRARMATSIRPSALQAVLRDLRASGSHPDEEVAVRIATHNKAFRVLAAIARAKAAHQRGRKARG